MRTSPLYLIFYESEILKADKRMVAVEMETSRTSVVALMVAGGGVCNRQSGAGRVFSPSDEREGGASFFGGFFQSCFWSGDQNSMVARTIGGLNVPAGRTTCQVRALAERQLGNLHWRKSATRIAPAVDGAVENYAPTRGEEIPYTDIVDRTFCR